MKERIKVSNWICRNLPNFDIVELHFQAKIAAQFGYTSIMQIRITKIKINNMKVAYNFCTSMDMTGVLIQWNMWQIVGT
jgi:hypothetical protein